MMILKERDSVVWIWLYLAQHQSFTGETRSWSRGIELGPRPRLEFHFTSDLHNQAYTEPKCLFLWLTWLHSLTSHLSAQSPDVLCQSVPSVISSSQLRLRAAAWARIRLRLLLTDRLESCCSLQSPGHWPGFCPSVDLLSAVSDSDTGMRTVTPEIPWTWIKASKMYTCSL